jgi:inward rectifier potassium channel
MTPILMKQPGKSRKKSILDTGFSNQAEKSGSRLLNKDGSFNVKKTGLFFLDRFSVFHWLIKMSWLRFFLFMFLGYVIINLFFASLYFVAGIEGLSGDHTQGLAMQFLDAFYFSSQTLTTVGYGYFSPLSEFHSLLAAFESFIGLMSFAMATGLLYGKFSKPKSGIVFAENALISPYKEDGKGLMIRLANSKDNEIINLSAILMISWVDAKIAGSSRKFYVLNLEISKIALLPTSWTIVHPINEESPLDGFSYEEMLSNETELILQLQGYDESYAHEVHSRRSYKSDEIIWGAKFEPILNHDEYHATLDLDRIGTWNKVDIKN